MGVSTLFSHKPHVVVQDFTEFSTNAKHFPLFEGKSKNLGFLRTGKKSTRTGTGPSLTIAYMSIIRCKEYTV